MINQDAFFGTGTYDQVFKVKCQNGATAALKIVPEHLSLAEAESNTLQAAKNTGDVVTVLQPHAEINNGGGGAFVIAPVGKPVEQATLSKARIFDITEVLFKLHSAGFLHADPCLSNLIFDDKKFLWIDFMFSASTLKSGWITDAPILSQSILGQPNNSNLPDEIVRLISEYGSEKTLESCKQLAEELWKEYLN
ncbi:hypothetical protein HK100_010988, partial [Physocladia obscura]